MPPAIADPNVAASFRRAVLRSTGRRYASGCRSSKTAVNIAERYAYNHAIGYVPFPMDYFISRDNANAKAFDAPVESPYLIQKE
jgi:hypothetical protein